MFASVESNEYRIIQNTSANPCTPIPNGLCFILLYLVSGTGYKFTSITLFKLRTICPAIFSNCTKS